MSDDQWAVGPHSELAAKLRCPTAVWLVWACFLIRGITYGVALPIWEGFDEWAHFAYIQHLLKHHELPNQTTTPVSQLVYKSLMLAPLPWTQHNDAPGAMSHDQFWQLPPATRVERGAQLKSLDPALAAIPATDGPRIYEAQQPPLYYLMMSLPLHLLRSSNLPTQVLLLRSISLILCSLFIPLSYLVARRVFADQSLAIASTALAVAMPELLIHVARITSDALALPIFTLLLLTVICWADNPLHWRYALACGFVLGFGLLTKLFFLTALPAIVLIFCRIAFKEPGIRRSLLLRAAVPCGIAGIMISPWLWHNLQTGAAWSGLVDMAVIDQLPLWQRISRILQVNWRNAADSIFNSHIWFGGWSFLTVRSWIYHAFRGIFMAAGIGLLVLAAPKRTPVMSGLIRLRSTLFSLAALYAFFCLGLAYHVLAIFLAYGKSTSAGWYLYSLVVAEAILLLAGLRALVGQRARHWIAPSLLVCYTLLDLYTFHFLLLPYHTGLIFHRPDGSLMSFHLSDLKAISFQELLGRLLMNRPDFLGHTSLVVLWIVFLLASACLIGVVFRAAWGELRNTQQHGV